MKELKEPMLLFILLVASAVNESIALVSGISNAVALKIWSDIGLSVSKGFTDIPSNIGTPSSIVDCRPLDSFESKPCI